MHHRSVVFSSWQTLKRHSYFYYWVFQTQNSLGFAASSHHNGFLRLTCPLWNCHHHHPRLHPHRDPHSRLSPPAGINCKVSTTATRWSSTLTGPDPRQRHRELRRSCCLLHPALLSQALRWWGSLPWPDWRYTDGSDHAQTEVSYDSGLLIA